jgi:predicted transcriptional regulator
MRVILHDIGGPVGVTDAARMAGLSTTGARKALEVLASLGVVVRVGTGRAQKYGPTEEGLFASPLTQLFEQERRQYEDLVRGLREAVAMPEVKSAWLKDMADLDERALEIDVLVETKSLGWIGPELRTRIMTVEKRFDIIVEVNTWTRADAPEMPTDAVLLWGTNEVAGRDRPPGAQTHAESSERSWKMARVIADMIRSDPSLARRALQYTNMLVHEGQGTANSDLGEWRQLLETYSADRLRDLLVSRSSRADRLRRSSPFFAVLTVEERDRVMQEIEGKR